MLIHVVNVGDTLESIAAYYGMPAATIIRDNGIENPDNLAVGQSIIIAFPEITHIVREGDTLIGIANIYGVNVMQLLRNNPFLAEQQYLTPGEMLVVKYPTRSTMIIHGNTVPYINRTTLRKTLPSLTYLSVLNYTATAEGEIITYYDDSEVIQMARAYYVVPLMLITTLSIQGEANVGVEYDLLLNQAFQERYIDNILIILREKGYSGVNISLQYVNVSNINLYEDYLRNITARLNEAGYQVFVTVNPNIRSTPNGVTFESVDYTVLNSFAQNIIFMHYQWATNINPPSPVTSIYNLNVFIDYLLQYIPPDNVIVGIPTIGYDWELPYSAGFSTVYSLTFERAINMAAGFRATIQFDEVSQTPFYFYTINRYGNNILHVVWFIDARSINSLLRLITSYQLGGSGIWNITLYQTQLWLAINSQFEIEKIMPMY